MRFCPVRFENNSFVDGWMALVDEKRKKKWLSCAAMYYIEALGAPCAIITHTQ